MAKKAQENVKVRKTLFQKSQERVPMSFDVYENDFKDNVEIVDPNGNIVVSKRLFAQDDCVDDYKIDVLREVNPSALNPSNYCTMSGGVPIDVADKVGSYMSNVDSKVDSMEFTESLNSVSSVDEDNNNDKKVEE